MRELKERNQAIRRWRKRGLTYANIGFIFGGLSRQRIEQICHKKQVGFWAKFKEVWFWLRVIK